MTIGRPKHINIEKYRYQIVPRTLTLQTRIDKPYQSLEELISMKNDLLADVLRNDALVWNSSRYDIAHKLSATDEDSFYFRIAPKRSVKVKDKDFNTRQVEDHPDVAVLFFNHPDVQILGIERNFRAFTGTAVVAKIIQNTLADYLIEDDLVIYIEPIFIQSDFWEHVRKHKGNITQLSFELIRPNLADISGSIPDVMKRLQKDSNSHKTNLELNAPKDGTLESVNEDNEDISGLVEYASEGGGEVSLKVKGVRNKIKTKKMVRTSEFKEIEIIGQSPEDVLKVYKRVTRK